MNARRRVPLFILDEIERVARTKAQLPTAKELAARGGCTVDQVRYHLRKIFHRERRIAEKV